MRAIILAAGMGRRMKFNDERLPKVMFSFGGKTLLQRHIDILRHCGIDEIVVAVGYCADLIEAEIADLGCTDSVETIHNPDYEQGSIVTLWSVREALGRGGDVILMDGDVLYDYRMMERLMASEYVNCFLMDRDFEEGPEPTKLCVRNGYLVEFHKVVTVAYDFWGESVGFFRLSEDMARRMVPVCKRFLDADMKFELYDEALRDLLITDLPGTFGFEDITGLPWTEIDFKEDVDYANETVIHKLLDHRQAVSESVIVGD